MKDSGKTKEELIAEIAVLKQHIAELEVRQVSENENTDGRCLYVLNHLMEGCQVVGYDWRYLYINDAGAEHGGKTREELLGHTVMDVFPEIVESPLFEQLDRCMTERVSHKMDTQLAHDDGSIRWFELQIQPVPEGLFVLTIDITKRKEALVLAQESAEKLHLFIQYAPISVAMFDREMRYLAVSDRWRETYHRQDEVLIGRNHYDTLPDMPDSLREIHQRGLAGEIIEAESEKFQLADGTTQWLRWGVFPWYLANGEVGGIVIFSENITDRMAALEKLRDSEAQFRTIVEQIPAITYVVPLHDMTGLLYISPQVERLLGVPVEEYQSTPRMWDQHVHPDDHQRVLAELDYSHRHEEAFSSEYRMFARDGRMMWVHDVADIVRDDEGKALFLQGLMIDITEQKTAEEKLQKSIERIETLLKIEEAITSTLDLDQVLEIIMAALDKASPYDSIAVQLFMGEALEIIACKGFEHPEKVIGQQYPIAPEFPNYKVITSKQSVAIENIVEEYPLFHTETNKYNSNDIRSWLGIPLVYKDRVIGMISIDRDAIQPFTNEEIQMAGSIATHAAMAVENARLFGEADQRLKRLHALRQIDRAIISSFELTPMLEVLLDQVIQHLEVDAADILLYNPRSGLLEYATGRGFHANEISVSTLKLGQGYSGRAALFNTLENIPDFATADPPFLRSNVVKAEGFVSFWAVPLVVKEEVLGVLEIFHRSPLITTSEWVNFFEALGGQAAIAINNSHLFSDLQRSNQELRQAYDATIEGWSRAMDLRDRETEGHTERVTMLTIRLARMVGLSEEEIVHAKRGALLHDMGKLGIPDSILLKNGQLTSKEWRIMKMHPRFAYDMLSGIDYLRPALDIPHCHHEKWDGSGYPHGLKGEEIPLAARIFAVVDVWDALRSDRPYRKAWTREQTLEYMLDQSGKHFDPKIVKTFLELLEDCAQC